MFKFLLVVHTLIAAGLVGVILMQRSEGGGLAGGGSPTGLLSARGAGDFLTRTTAILATLFILLSIGLAAIASINRGPRELDNSLKRAPVTAPALPSVPMGGTPQPVPGAAPLGSVPTTTPQTAPVARQEAPKPAEPKAAVKREPQPAPKAERVQLPPVTTAPKPEAAPAAAPAATPSAPKESSTPQ